MATQGGKHTDEACRACRTRSCSKRKRTKDGKPLVGLEKSWPSNPFNPLLRMQSRLSQSHSTDCLDLSLAPYSDFRFKKCLLVMTSRAPLLGKVKRKCSVSCGNEATRLVIQLVFDRHHPSYRGLRCRYDPSALLL